MTTIAIPGISIPTISHETSVSGVWNFSIRGMDQRIFMACVTSFMEKYGKYLTRSDISNFIDGEWCMMCTVNNEGFVKIFDRKPF